ncbi:hypothetical protein HY772_09870 [Candidatus Woesearchaeota archaeon]|nr:hypothetical protein [Candidatus Woesearchaeota archaeon]
MKRTRHRALKGTIVATQQKLTPHVPHTAQFFLYLATLKEQLTFTSEKHSPEYQSKLPDGPERTAAE